MQKKYKWEQTRGFNPVNPDIAGRHIEALERRDGQITGKSLLDSARPQDSDMHPCYEWNDGIAAEKYRLRQSNLILNSLVSVVITGEDEEAQNRYEKVYINVSSSDKGEAGKFVSIQTAFANEVYRNNVLRKALAEAITFRHKYEELKELSNIFAAIDEAEQRLKED